MPPPVRFVIPALLVLTLAPPSAPRGAARDIARAATPTRARVTFHAPVDAPVIDPFRAPPTPYAAGNRGVEYATAPGSAVHAAAAGVVLFAGQVGGTLDVVVLHADAVRTTYGSLASLAVHVGDHVDAGAVVGTSGPTLHFGARAGRAYVDPAVLLAPSAGRARLVPVPS